MNTLIKKYWYRIPLTIGYILIFASFIYSIFYSMPANDDFAWAVEWWSSNRVVEMFHRIGWNYMNSFGNSGIFAIAIQVLFNPLYLFDNVGHSFGICMIIVNTIIMTGILWAVRTLFKYIFQINSQVALDIITFLVALLVTTSYYYSDVYNWWSGTPGYSGMMMMCLVSCAAMLRYNADRTKKRYIAMIVLGMIACTSMMYCVAVGAFYVVYTFIVYLHNGDRIGKKLLPLGMYILSGVLMVIAPGNYTRMSNEESSDASLFNAVIVTGYRILTRLKTTIQTKPWVVAIMLLILLLGLFIGSNRKHNLLVIIFGAACTIVAAFSGLLLYVYGSNKTIDAEFTPRVYYVEDYMVFIGMAIAIYAIGAWIKQIIGVQINTMVAAGVSVIVVLLSAAYIMTGGRYAGVIQVDILAHADLIKESWVFWDEILQEVESAEDGAELVINRENVDWCQYSYYVSLDEIPRETLTEDAKYGNCNQCASKYYGVDSIIVNLY